jgi:hypothetical protein
MSFDNLTSCAKCQHDLAEVQAELQGTAIQADECFFLDSALLTGDSVPADHQPEAEASEMEDIDTDNQAEDNIPEPEKAQAEAVLEPEEVSAPEVAEIVMEPETADTDTPDLALDEVMAPPAQEEDEPQAQTADMESLASPEEEPQASPEDEHIAADEEGAETALDINALTLEINDEEPEAAAEESEKDDGQIPIDLEQIDLSDLLHPPEQTAPAAQSTEETADQDDKNGTPDLNLEDTPANPEPDLDDLTLEIGSADTGPELKMEDTDSEDTTLDLTDLV